MSFLYLCHIPALISMHLQGEFSPLSYGRIAEILIIIPESDTTSSAHAAGHGEVPHAESHVVVNLMTLNDDKHTTFHMPTLTRTDKHAIISVTVSI